MENMSAGMYEIKIKQLLFTHILLISMISVGILQMICNVIDKSAVIDFLYVQRILFCKTVLPLSVSGDDAG